MKKRKREREMALRGQIINDTQPFCSVKEQNHIVGTHTHTHTPLLTQVPPLQCSSIDLQAGLSSAVAQWSITLQQLFICNTKKIYWAKRMC